jgi:hypothetical protein
MLQKSSSSGALVREGPATESPAACEEPSAARWLMPGDIRTSCCGVSNHSRTRGGSFWGGEVNSQAEFLSSATPTGPCNSPPRPRVRTSAPSHKQSRLAPSRQVHQVSLQRASVRCFRADRGVVESLALAMLRRLAQPATLPSRLRPPPLLRLRPLVPALASGCRRACTTLSSAAGTASAASAPTGIATAAPLRRWLTATKVPLLNLSISDLFGHVAFALAGTAFLDPDILNLRLLSVASGGATYATQGSNLRRWARGRSGLLLTRRSRLALRQAGLHVLPPGRPAALAALRLELPLHAHQLR